MGFGTPPAVAVELEGDYSDWTQKWSLTGLGANWRITEIVAYDKALDRIFFRTPDKQRVWIRKLSDGSAVSEVSVNDFADEYTRVKAIATVRAIYFIYVTGGVLHIYKNNEDIKQIDLTAAPLNWGSGDLIWATISWDGKYIFCHDFNNEEAALFEGS